MAQAEVRAAMQQQDHTYATGLQLAVHSIVQLVRFASGHKCFVVHLFGVTALLAAALVTGSISVQRQCAYLPPAQISLIPIYLHECILQSIYIATMRSRPLSIGHLRA